MSRGTFVLLVCFVVLVLALAWNAGGMQAALVLAVILCALALMGKLIGPLL